MNATSQLFVFAATTAKKSSSGSTTLFFILILLAVGAYFFMRPRRKLLREQQQAGRQVDVGDEVVTTSGIIGRVISFVGNRVELEIAPGTTVEVMRQSIARRAEPNVATDETAHDEPPHDSALWPAPEETSSDHDADGGSPAS